MAYPVPKAYQRLCLLRCLDVAVSDSSPKAAQTLGYRLTPGLWVTFGRVTCMAPLPQCLGYGHWVFYCCVARVFGFGLCLLTRLSWLQTVACVLGFGLLLHPANTGWGPWRVCLGTGSALPRHSWIGFVVCRLGTGSALTPPLPDGVCGMRVLVWVVCQPCQSCLPCVVYVWVPVLPEPEYSWLVLWRLFAYMFCFHPPFLAGYCGNPGLGLLLALIGWLALANPCGSPCGCSSTSILAGVCCRLCWRGWSLAHLRGWPCGYSSSPVPARRAAGFVVVVPCHSWRRAFGVQFSVTPGWGLLLALVGWGVPRQSWRRGLLVQFSANPGWVMLLAMVGWSIANHAEGPAGAVPRHCQLARVAGLGGMDGSWPILAARLEGAVPCQSWLPSAAVLGGAYGPSLFLADALVGAVPRHSWLGPAAGLGAAVPCLPWRRALWPWYSAFPGPGLLLVLVGWVVLCHSQRRALWVQFPATPGWGVLLGLLMRSPAIYGGGPRWWRSRKLKQLALMKLLICLPCILLLLAPASCC